VLRIEIGALPLASAAADAATQQTNGCPVPKGGTGRYSVKGNVRTDDDGWPVRWS